MNAHKQIEASKNARMMLQGFNQMLVVMGGPPLAESCNEMYARVNLADRELVKVLAASAAQKVVETWALEQLEKLEGGKKKSSSPPTFPNDSAFRALAKEVVQAVYSLPTEGDLFKLAPQYARDDQE